MNITTFTARRCIGSTTFCCVRCCATACLPGVSCWSSAGLFALAIILPAFRLVPLKMLPFDNKNEFQIVVDMDEGTTLETTEAATRDLARYLRTVPEVVNFTGTVGLASPMDFNGLVRHYFLRKGRERSGFKSEPAAPRKRARNNRMKSCCASGAIWKPSGTGMGPASRSSNCRRGPPVIATVTAEIHGRFHHSLRHVPAGGAGDGRTAQEGATGGGILTPRSRPTKPSCSS